MKMRPLLWSKLGAKIYVGCAVNGVASVEFSYRLNKHGFYNGRVQLGAWQEVQHVRFEAPCTVEEIKSKMEALLESELKKRYESALRTIARIEVVFEKEGLA